MGKEVQDNGRRHARRAPARAWAWAGGARTHLDARGTCAHFTEWYFTEWYLPRVDNLTDNRYCTTLYNFTWLARDMHCYQGGTW